MEDRVFAGTVFLRGGGNTRCTLELGTGGLTLRSPDGRTDTWPYQSLLCETAGEEDAYLLLKPSDPGSGPFDSVTLRDPSFNVALAGRIPAFSDFLSGFGLRHRRRVTGKWRDLLLAGAAFLLLLVGGYWAVTLEVADWAAQKMPVSLEVKWGGAISKTFLASKKEVTSGPAYDAAQALFARLKSALPKDTPYPLELHVVEDPSVNAFALPGGQVMLLTGLMRDARSPEEVAGVLAHEIQHVLKRHVVKRLVQELGWRAWFSVFFGGGDLSSVAFGAGSLMQLSYGRAQETEADVEGAKLLQAAGISPAPLAAFFERLSGREGPASKVPAFISTHPDSRKRAEELKRLAETLVPADPRPLDVDWEAVQEALR